MFTSSYSSVPDSNPGAISISLGPPRDKLYSRYKPLAPGSWFRTASFDGYLRLYYQEILLRLDPNKVWCELHELADSAQPMLLCYENNRDFCHRRLAAMWLETELGLPAPILEIQRDEVVEPCETKLGIVYESGVGFRQTPGPASVEPVSQLSLL